MIENIAVPVYYIVVTLNPDVTLDSLFWGREGSKVVTCLHTQKKNNQHFKHEDFVWVKAPGIRHLFTGNRTGSF